MCLQTVGPTPNWVLWGASARGAPHRMQETTSDYRERQQGLRISVALVKVYNGDKPPRTINIHQKKSYVLTNVRVPDLDVLGESDDSGCVADASLHSCKQLHAATGRMTHSSNVFIHGSTINSERGDIHTNKEDSGTHDFSPLQKSIFINDAII